MPLTGIVVHYSLFVWALTDIVVHCSLHFRPNLYLSVSLKSNDIIRDLKSQLLICEAGCGEEFVGPTIIYCPTKKSAEHIHNMVKGKMSLTLHCS